MWVRGREIGWAGGEVWGEEERWDRKEEKRERGERDGMDRRGSVCRGRQGEREVLLIMFGF